MPDGTDISFTVHPAAEAFPMLPEDELQSLADDIKAKGLYHPIVLSADGTELIDGRNRLAACTLAGVEPRFDRLPKNVDPRVYIVSANIYRRHITKGQKALAVALIYPEGTRGRHRDPARENIRENRLFSEDRLEQARRIIKHPDLVEQVKSGILPFDYALKQATERATVQQNAEQFMAVLQAEAPDLAALVSEERLNLAEAWRTFEQRKTDEALAERERCETYMSTVERITRGLTAMDNEGFEGGLRERLDAKTGFKSTMLDRQSPDLDIPTLERGFAKLKKILRKISL
jgi:hypothetical protein